MLDQWLRQRAMRNERNGSSRTYVICVETQVIAYYCLAAGSITSTMAPGNIRRNTPDPIPIMVLGRLAVDLRWQRKGVGRALLRDAILRTAQVAEIAGLGIEQPVCHGRRGMDMRARAGEFRFAAIALLMEVRAVRARRQAGGGNPQQHTLGGGGDGNSAVGGAVGALEVRGAGHRGQDTKQAGGKKMVGAHDQFLYVAPWRQPSGNAERAQRCPIALQPTRR